MSPSRALAIALSVAVSFACLCSLRAQAQLADETRQVQHQGINREFILYRPAGATSAVPRPLVIVLHGLGMAAGGARKWGYEQVADREGLIVAYPQGIDQRWSYGRPITERPMPRVGEQQVDDVGFLAKLADALIAERLADTSRIFVVGLSNGALMAYTVACSMTQRVAAVAALLSPMTNVQIEDCRPEGTIAILVLGGTQDRDMPYAGVELHFGRLVSTRETIQYWREINRCDRFRATPLPHRNSDDPTSVSVMRWPTCADGVEMISYRIERGGHRAPSLAAPDDAELEREGKWGTRNRDIETAEEVWNFFKHFKRE